MACSKAKEVVVCLQHKAVQRHMNGAAHILVLVVLCQISCAVRAPQTSTVCWGQPLRVCVRVCVCMRVCLRGVGEGQQISCTRF
jgi:hypothetical protein